MQNNAVFVNFLPRYMQSNWNLVFHQVRCIFIQLHMAIASSEVIDFSKGLGMEMRRQFLKGSQA